MNIQALITELLPIEEEIASVFIHNPNSQHKFVWFVSTVNELAPVFAQITATVVSSPVIPAGVPSAH